MKKKIVIQGNNDVIKEYEEGTTLLEISKDYQQYLQGPVVVAKIGNELKELFEMISENKKVTFLDYTNEDGMKVYRRSLCFVLIRAASEVLPNCRVKIEHSLGKGFYCEIQYERELQEQDVRNIEEKMREIVEKDESFHKKTLDKKDAMDLFGKNGQSDKVRLFKYRKSNTVNIYECGQIQDYFYGYMAPSTGILKKFKLYFKDPGFVIQFPDPKDPSLLPGYKELNQLSSVFMEAEKWGRILEVEDVGALNDIISDGKIEEFIRVAEALHEKKFAQIADKITERKDEIGVVLIAGPSSSGKTTSAQRLGVQLRVNGLKPVAISLDDYFVNREYTPKDENGDYDFEALEAIDVALFNEHLTQLLEGKEVEVPIFNFHTGQREFIGKKLKLDIDNILIIEGIHGLNEKLTSSIPKKNKFKIYVSALTQLNIDQHNRIPTTDTRLIRRIARDFQFRGNDAKRTIELWPSVRRGEEKNIFPYQEEADVMFNSALLYELAALKNYVEPQLKKITPDMSEYTEAKRLLKFLDYFLPAETKNVPCNSIIREFIGGSCFY